MAHLRLEIDAESMSDEERKVAADALRRALGLPERTRPIIGERAQVRAWGLLWELEGESLLRSRQLATTGTADCPVTTG